MKNLSNKETRLQIRQNEISRLIEKGASVTEYKCFTYAVWADEKQNVCYLRAWKGTSTKYYVNYYYPKANERGMDQMFSRVKSLKESADRWEAYELENAAKRKENKPVTKADKLRQALKDAGYNSRQVSVKQSPCTYSWSMDVTIRDASVDYHKVKAIAKSFEKIDRCEASGEILSGGNTFVSVKVDENVYQAWATDFTDTVKATIETLGEDSGEQIKGTEFVIFKSGWNGIRAFKDGSFFGEYHVQRPEALAVAIKIGQRI